MQKRAAKLEKAAIPTLSPFSVMFGSFNEWVEREVLPGVESGALYERVMVEVVACLRRWETDGTWGREYAC